MAGRSAAHPKLGEHLGDQEEPDRDDRDKRYDVE